ncbi:MAG: tetratricopeptide repeat protein [Daejeonella sp.]|uniref:tetratricopeptide repeat protein n=1 Tax=Daejeonella sp. TaxID=2805397 RepID=UPI002735B52A|nr:tetratricopeptide repeat protein [Daejeonella sp.]MDP3468040.1 tetratricopeptide repeat protein [Daejeonella sp.]
MNKQTSSGVREVKDYLITLQFREHLKASDDLPLVFPTSAGVYNGTLQSDSLSAFDQLLFLSRNLGDRKAEAGVLNSYAVSHALNGKMDDAVLLLNEAILLNLEVNNKFAVRNNYLTLQRINRYRGNLSEALKYNEAVLMIDMGTKNSRLIAEAYMDQAEILTSQRNYSEAETLVLRKALPLYYYGLKDKAGTIRCYDQLADNYHRQKKFTEAKWFYIQSNMLARKINSPSGIVNSLINLAHVKMSIGDYQLALLDYKEAEQLSVKNKFTNKLIEIKSDLADVYSKLGNAGASSSAFSEFKVMKETFLRTIR